MSAQLNHTIVWCRNKRVSATFLVEILGSPAADSFGPMLIVKLDNGVSLDFYDNDSPIASQHYAFLIGDDDFDAAFARLQATSCRGGPIPASYGPARSMTMAVDGGCTSMTRMATCWKS